MASNSDFTTHKRESVVEVFGPGSDSRKAADLARRDPALYNSLKQAAVYEFGLLPEEMLNRASRVKKEDREARHRANLAAQKDESFPLAPALADRLGVPADTKVSWETFQRLMGRQND